jgi:hypothetical protein
LFGSGFFPAEGNVSKFKESAAVRRAAEGGFASQIAI